MADTRVINLEDGVVVEKRGRGRPRGSKNKPKASVAEISSSTLAKLHHDRPLGSKNKVKTSATPTNISKHLDVSLAQPNPLQPSTGALFSFLPLLAPNVVNNSAFLSNLLNSWKAESFAKLFYESCLVMDPHMKKFTTTVKVICFSGVAGLALLKTMICIKGGS
jgi:hypothetical protein